MPGSASSSASSSSESSLRIYEPLVAFEDEDDKRNLDFGYAPQNRRHARKRSRGLIGVWKDVTRKLRKPERASVLPPGFEIVAAQRRRTLMLAQIAERIPGLVGEIEMSPSAGSSESGSPSLPPRSASLAPQSAGPWPHSAPPHLHGAGAWPHGAGLYPPSAGLHPRSAGPYPPSAGSYSPWNA